MGATSAKRAARGHSVFNLFGVLWVLILYHPFLFLVSKIITAFGCDNPLVAGASSESLLYSVAMVHSLFNICNTLILVWFIPQIVKLVTWLVKSPKEEEVFRLKYIQGGLLNTAELSLGQAKAEVIHFAELCRRQYEYAKQALNATSEEQFDELYKKLEHYEQITDRVEFEIAKYLNMQVTVYQRYERGEREIPIWAVIRLACYYQVSLDYLVGLTDCIKPYPMYSWI